MSQLSFKVSSPPPAPPRPVEVPLWVVVLIIVVLAACGSIFLATIIWWERSL